MELISTLDTIKIHQRLGEQKHYFYVRITLIITGLISLGLGIYILLDFDSFFSEKYKINYRKSLLIFFLTLESFLVSLLYSLTRVLILKLILTVE